MRYVFILAIAVAGCASSIAGNDLGGTVEGGASATMPSLFEKAEAHCNKYAKKARITGSQPQTNVSYAVLSFACV